MVVLFGDLFVVLFGDLFVVLFGDLFVVLLHNLYNDVRATYRRLYDVALTTFWRHLTSSNTQYNL